MSNSIFETFESEVRSYCRQFPAVFARALGHRLIDEDGRSFVDFLSGAGSLNYGHNNPFIMEAVAAYIRDGGIVHSLDLHTSAKARFIDAFQAKILSPRGMDYKLQFPGPTGTNAVEAAFKLARKVTGRPSIVAFTNAFHGMSLGALAATANPGKRRGAGTALPGVHFMPYDGFLGDGVDTMDYVDAMLSRPGSGCDAPAAVVVEIVQGEGGLNAASAAWLRRLERVCRAIGSLLIVDDIQAGCGRTGTFFSFEGLGISPDIVVLSKSLSGCGLPFALVLLRPALDVWDPGEHNGTFRGNNLAFVGATAAIETYWSDATFASEVGRKSDLTAKMLGDMVAALPPGAARAKGRGMLTGLEFADPPAAEAISHALFAKGIIIETCGVFDQTLKLLPSLTIPDSELHLTLEHVHETVLEIVGRRSAVAA